MRSIPAILAGVVLGAAMLMCGGCGNGNGGGNQRAEDIVDVSGTIVQQAKLGEYVMDTILGRVILKPRFFEGMFLKAGDRVVVKGVWTKAAGGPPIISDATVTVVPQ